MPSHAPNPTAQRQCACVCRDIHNSDLELFRVSEAQRLGEVGFAAAHGPKIDLLAIRAAMYFVYGSKLPIPQQRFCKSCWACSRSRAWHCWCLPFRSCCRHERDALSLFPMLRSCSKEIAKGANQRHNARSTFASFLTATSNSCGAWAANPMRKPALCLLDACSAVSPSKSMPARWADSTASRSGMSRMNTQGICMPPTGTLGSTKSARCSRTSRASRGLLVFSAISDGTQS